MNKTLAVLSRILEQAVEYEHMTRNPAAGKRRRLRTTRPPRLFLEPAQVTALLDAASESYVMDQMGHADSKMTMDVYSKALKSKRRRAHARRIAAASGPALDAAVNGQAMGTNAAGGPADAEEQRAS